MPRNIVLSMLVLCALLSPAMICAADIPADSGFMDLESSIEALRSRVGKAQSSVVLVIAYDDSGKEIRRGSGVIIDTEGRIITNAFIIQDAYSAEVVRGRRSYREVVVLNRDEDLDVALLQVNVTDDMPIDPDFEYDLRPGQRVLVIGRASNTEITVSEGLIDVVKRIGEKGELIKVDITEELLSNRYSEDGPLINIDGKVIGIASRVITGSGENDFIPKDHFGVKVNAVSIRSIKPLIEGPYNRERLNPAGTFVSYKGFIRKVKEYIVSYFVKLYSLGYTKLIAIVIGFIFLISVTHWLFSIFRKKLLHK